jgi:hypothetical protein
MIALEHEKKVSRTVFATFPTRNGSWHFFSQFDSSHSIGVTHKYSGCSRAARTS